MYSLTSSPPRICPEFSNVSFDAYMLFSTKFQEILGKQVILQLEKRLAQLKDFMEIVNRNIQYETGITTYIFNKIAKILNLILNQLSLLDAAQGLILSKGSNVILEEDTEEDMEEDDDDDKESIEKKSITRKNYRIVQAILEVASNYSTIIDDLIELSKYLKYFKPRLNLIELIEQNVVELGEEDFLIFVPKLSQKKDATGKRKITYKLIKNKSDFITLIELIVGILEQDLQENKITLSNFTISESSNLQYAKVEYLTKSGNFFEFQG